MTSLKLRIQMGRYKGRMIHAVGADIRPSMGWAREVMFNWLMSKMPGMLVMDACSGSGILAFEALSLGAKKVVCIDANACHLKGIKQQAEKLKVSIEVLEHHWPQPFNDERRFDLVLWDPPYKAEWRKDIFRLCDAGGWLKYEGLVCIESMLHDEYDHEGWVLLKTRARGGTKIQLWKKI